MARRGKKYIKAKDLKKNVEFSMEEAIEQVKKLAYSNFTGSVELHLALKLPKDRDPKSVKGSVSLPHSSGKQKTVYVFTSPENVAKAQSAGADKVGLEDLVKEVQSGKISFDVAIATPDVMAKIAILGKELGPKGLMPNPKTGTVASGADLEEAIKAYKKGKQTFAADGQGGIHMGVGKINLETKEIVENIETAISAIEDVFGKGISQILVSAHLAPTMGPSAKFTYTRESAEN